VQPQYVAGYSLGEYSAACICGLFDFEAGLSLVIDRASTVMALPRSGMIAVSAGYEEICALLEPGLHVVAANSQVQTILGGEKPVLDRAALALQALGHIVRELPVHHALHTPLMRPAAVRLAELFSAVKTATPIIPLVSTVSGELMDVNRLIDPQHWARHLCEPIQLVKALKTLDRLGIHTFLEVGPGQALSSVIESQFGHRPSTTIATSMPADYDTHPVAVHLRQSAGRLSTAGVPVGGVPTFNLHPTPSRTESAPAAAVAAELAVIGKVQDICSEVLRHAGVGPDENLFDLAADSLKTARIALGIRNYFDIELSLRDIYSSATPRQLAQVISAAQRIWCGVADLVTLPNGLTIRCPSRPEAIQLYDSIFEQRAVLRNGIKIARGATVVDVGAHIGMFSTFAALAAPGVRLYSFEPIDALFEMLRFNLADVCEDAILFNTGLEALADTIDAHSLLRIDLLRLDTRRIEPLLLQCIPQSQWARVEQVVIETLDGDGRVAAARELLADCGFLVNVVPEPPGREVSLYASRCGNAR
jgi:acyl carrier protein